MINEGALFIDIGVASSKPGSKLITPENENKLLKKLSDFKKLKGFKGFNF